MKVSIIGAGGLAGKELIGLLANHSEFEIVHITSDKVAGKKISQVFPNLKYPKDLVFKKHEDEIPKDSIVVLGVPNEASLELVPKLANKGNKIVDLSGAYRLNNQSIFEKYYKLKHESFSLLKEFVFGIPEIFREKLKNANLVSNPGCFSTSAILPIYFLAELREKILGSIVIDSKTGVSGAGGRTEDIGFSFTNTYENFRAYKILSHQHTPEIQEYSEFGLKQNLKKIIFTPHLLPVYRGILTTIVIQFSDDVTEEKIKSNFEKFKSETFIKFIPEPEKVELKDVQFSNNLNLSYRFDKEEKVLVIISALDNLVKGASGQALQNMNLMCGFEESMGLV
jgi:N-acetyl-gamma-glutamyl-phosphate reductase